MNQSNETNTSLAEMRAGILVFMASSAQCGSSSRRLGLPSARC